MTRLILGIDPGLSGALAYFDPASDWVETHDMPTFEIVRNRKAKREIDRPRLAAIVGMRAHETSRVIVEQVGAGKDQGTASMFAFGKAAGAALTAPVCFSLPVVEVPPSVWKRYMGVTADKNSSRAKATQLFPHHAEQWKLKKHDGRAEAVLLAVYANRYLK